MQDGETTVEAKQQFLVEEIINRGYNPDDFTLWIDKEEAKGCLLLTKDANWNSGR